MKVAAMSMESASNGFQNYSTAMMAGDLARPDTASRRSTSAQVDGSWKRKQCRIQKLNRAIDSSDMQLLLRAHDPACRILPHASSRVTSRRSLCRCPKRPGGWESQEAKFTRRSPSADCEL